MKTTIKFIFVAGLLYFLAQRGFLSVDETARALSQWKWVSAGFVFMTISMFLGIVRWHILLLAQGIQIEFGRTLRLGLIGNFFNIALPGAVSGDLVKAVYVSKECGGKKAPAFSSILFDRVAGVSGLVLISAFALLLSARSEWGGKLVDALEIFILATGAGVVAFYAYLFLLKDHHDPVLRLCALLEKRSLKWGGAIKRSYEGLRIYREHRSTVAWALLISLVIHSLVITAAAFFARALGDDTIAVQALFVVVPLGLLVTAIPVTPAGVGTGHAAFTALFHLIGSQMGANVFNFYLIPQLFFGAMGGLVYLRFKKPGQSLSFDAEATRLTS